MPRVVDRQPEKQFSHISPFVVPRPKLAKGSWARYKFSRLGERRSRLVSERRRLFVNRRCLAALETDLGFRFLGGVATDKTISLSLFKQSATFCP